MRRPLVAIVGAPNVGKSTLFNRLVGRRRSIVTDQPGVTRDRIHGVAAAEGTSFELVDTGGQTPGSEAPFAREIEQQADVALARAALILYVVDVRAGATGNDAELLRRLRRRGIPILLLANKADTPKQDGLAHDLHELGLGDPLPVSAEHGRGINELLDEITGRLESSGATLDAQGAGEELDDEPTTPIRVAIVGRPNVGKSSLLNRLVGEERAVVSDVPGTTRDSVDTVLELGQRSYRLIDTAGIRRRGRVERGVERFSVDRAHRNIEGCDVAILVLDGTEPLAAQDTHIAGYMFDAFKPTIVAVNKWDIVEQREDAAKRWIDRVQYRLRFLKNVPLIYVSALNGQRVPRLLDLVDAQYELAGRRVPTSELNRWMERIRGGDSDAPAAGRGFRLYYATQTGARPLRFRLFCNDPDRLHFSRRRHIENSLRESFDLGAAPIRLDFKARRSDRKH